MQYKEYLQFDMKAKRFLHFRAEWYGSHILSEPGQGPNQRSAPGDCSFARRQSPVVRSLGFPTLEIVRYVYTAVHQSHHWDLLH